MGVSLSWLQKFINNLYRSVPCQIEVVPETITDLELECDELWSFVNSKENPIYLWLALERKTRLIVGVYLGNRSRKTAEEIWRSLPLVVQNNAQVYTDLWESYQQVIPAERHHPSTKKSGATTKIERLNNTLRQRCSRLVRKSVSFSRNLFNHEGAMFYFIHHYNEELLLN